MDKARVFFINCTTTHLARHHCMDTLDLITNAAYIHISISWLRTSLPGQVIITITH